MGATSHLATLNKAFATSGPPSGCRFMFSVLVDLAPVALDSFTVAQLGVGTNQFGIEWSKSGWYLYGVGPLFQIALGPGWHDFVLEVGGNLTTLTLDGTPYMIPNTVTAFDSPTLSLGILSAADSMVARSVHIDNVALFTK